jgi:hypothetical protein
MFAGFTCPDGKSVAFEFGPSVEFDPDWCDICPLKPKCTTAERGHRCTVAIAENEQLQHHLRRQISTPIRTSQAMRASQLRARIAALANEFDNLGSIPTARVPQDEKCYTSN